MTDPAVVKSWSREELESAFTQREVQLEECQRQRDNLAAACAAKDDALRWIAKYGGASNLFTDIQEKAEKALKVGYMNVSTISPT